MRFDKKEIKNLKRYLNKRSDNFEVQLRVEEKNFWLFDNEGSSWLSDDSLS